MAERDEAALTGAEQAAADPAAVVPEAAVQAIARRVHADWDCPSTESRCGHLGDIEANLRTYLAAAFGAGWMVAPTEGAETAWLAMLLKLADTMPRGARLWTQKRDEGWTMLVVSEDRPPWQWHEADLYTLLHNADATWPWVRTKDGTLLDEAAIQALADEAEAGYDVASLRERGTPEAAGSDDVEPDGGYRESPGAVD